jgi:hypothetical protein
MHPRSLNEALLSCAAAVGASPNAAWFLHGCAQSALWSAAAKLPLFLLSFIRGALQRRQLRNRTPKASPPLENYATSGVSPALFQNIEI